MPDTVCPQFPGSVMNSPDHLPLCDTPQRLCKKLTGSLLSIIASMFGIPFLSYPYYYQANFLKRTANLPTLEMPPCLCHFSAVLLQHFICIKGSIYSELKSFPFFFRYFQDIRSSKIKQNQAPVRVFTYIGSPGVRMLLLRCLLRPFSTLLFDTQFLLRTGI